MTNIEGITKNVEHFNFMAVCLIITQKTYESAVIPCHHKWMATVPKGTNLFKLECPKCRGQNSFASWIPDGWNK